MNRSQGLRQRALISPEWNVNNQLLDIFCMPALALISPEWNVNTCCPGTISWSLRLLLLFLRMLPFQETDKIVADTLDLLREHILHFRRTYGVDAG